MFIHDGLVHRRFPVGPIAELPYMKQIAVAHQLHHANKYGGAPWGIFLAMQVCGHWVSCPGSDEGVGRKAWCAGSWGRRLAERHVRKPARPTLGHQQVHARQVAEGILYA